MKNLKKNVCFMIFFFILLTILITFPLIFNLNGFLLTKDFDNINHSDTEINLRYINESINLLLEHKDFIITPKNYSLPQSYVLTGILFVNFISFDEIVFHNLFFMSSIFLSGVFMYFFMFELCKDNFASLYSGFIYMSSNWIISSYLWGHVNQMQIQWIPLVFLYLEKTIHYKKIKYGILLGLAFGIQILSSDQYTVYLSFILPVYILLRVIFTKRNIVTQGKYWLLYFTSLITAYLSSSFYLIKRLKIIPPIRSIQENLNKNFRMSFLNQLFEVERNIYIGHFQFLLIILGFFVIWSNFKKKKYRKYVPFFVLFIFLIFCMIGPTSFFAPYYWLYYLWPFFNNFGVVWRLFPFILMFSSILSSLILIFMNKNKKFRIFKIVFLIFSIMIILFFQNKNILSNSFHMYFP